MLKFNEKMTGDMFSCMRRIIYTPGITPLPPAVMMISFLTMLVNASISTMCFSYLPRLVKSFNIPEAQTGHYAGMIASSSYVGQVLFSVMWGYFADLKGRKRALLIAVMGMTATTFAFGFTTSFTWALVTRLLQGIFMGYLAICKSILSLALDDSNRPLGFTILLTGYTLAFTFGPSIGGFLSFPAEQYGHTFGSDSLLARFPILLPNVIIGVCNVIVVILIIIFLPNDREEKYQILENLPLIASSNDNGDTCVANADTSANGLVKDIWYDDTSAVTSLSKQHAVMKNQRLAARLVNRCPEKVIKVFTLFKSRDVNISLVLFPLISLSRTAVEEVFPVFAATTRQYHGLALTPSQIGILLLCSSCILIIVQITITPKILNYLGARKTFIGCQLLASCVVPLIPTSNLVANTTVMLVYTMFIMTVNQVIINATIIAINVVLNTIVDRDLSGSANAISITVKALGNVSAPFIFGSTYSWSLTNVKGAPSNHAALGFPFNQYFTFFLVALVCVFTALPATFLSSELTKLTTEVEEEMDNGNENY